MNKFLFFFTSIALVVVVSSCKNFNDIENAEIVSGDAEYAIPLFSSSNSLQDLLEEFDDQTTIEIAPDGLIILRYEGDITSRTSHDIIADALDDLTNLIPVADTVSQLPFESPNELEVDFATFSQGTVSFSFAHQDHFIKEITIKILQADNNGETLTMHKVWDTPTNIVFPPQFPEELTGVNLLPENGSLYVWYDARDEDGNRVIFDLDDDDLFVLQMKDIGFSYIEGYLGNHIHPGDRDTIEIDIFENWIEGDVYFDNPKVWVNVENSFGIPTESVINIFRVHTADGQAKDLVSDFLLPGEGIVFNYPDLNNIGQVYSTTFPFNKDNSNIDEILGARPVALDYEVDALTNPDTLTGIRGFLTDSSYYKVQVEVELPIHGTASGFGAIDTFDLDLSGYDDIDWAEFKVVAENEIPMDIEMQFYFTDDNGTVLDSLFDGRQRVIQAAPVDNEGIVLEKIKAETFAMLDERRFDNVRNASRIILQAFFSTYNEGQTSVKIFNTQEVEIRMGMKLGTQ